MSETKPGAILTVDEISDYLKIPRSTIYKLVREGKIPAQKIGRHWRFRKKRLTVGWKTNRAEIGIETE